jgi:hypothetical protein
MHRPIYIDSTYDGSWTSDLVVARSLQRESGWVEGTGVPRGVEGGEIPSSMRSYALMADSDSYSTSSLPGYVEPLLHAYGVDLTYAGHNHVAQRLSAAYQVRVSLGQAVCIGTPPPPTHTRARLLLRHLL